MKNSEAVAGIQEILADQKVDRVVLKKGGALPEPTPSDLAKHSKLSIWVWVLLIGADLAYELFAFADGSGGAPTLSQLIKAGRRAGGVAGFVGLIFALVAACVVLILHLGVELF